MLPLPSHHHGRLKAARAADVAGSALGIASQAISESHKEINLILCQSDLTFAQMASISQGLLLG